MDVEITHTELQFRRRANKLTCCNANPRSLGVILREKSEGSPHNALVAVGANSVRTVHVSAKFAARPLASVAALHALLFFADAGIKGPAVGRVTTRAIGWWCGDGENYSRKNDDCDEKSSHERRALRSATLSHFHC